MIQVLLLRSMYQFYDDNDYDNDISADDIHEEDNTITNIIRLVVLYQVKYKMIQPSHLLYRNYDDTIAITQLVLLYQDKYHTITDVSRNRILNGEYYFVLSRDALTNTTEDLTNTTEDNRNKILNVEYNVRCYCINTGKSVTSTDGEMLLFRLLFRLMYQVQVQVQAKYKMIRPIHSIDSNNNDTIIAGYSTTTIDGELILLFRLAYRVDRMYRVL